MVEKFKQGDLVELVGDRSKKVLVTATGWREGIFAGVVVSPAKETNTESGSVGYFDKGWAESAFELVDIEYTIAFKPRHKPRWRRGDLFEVNGSRFAAINDDAAPGVALALGGCTYPSFALLPKALGINIYDLESRS